MNQGSSISEDNGIALLGDKDVRVYSVGISTLGAAEARMVRLNPKRHVVATTIDQEGVEFLKKSIAKQGLADRIEVRLEDVGQPLPYADAYFDFVYARLVLHYLPSAKLAKTLLELKRVLKPGGRMFVVVRSAECADANDKDATYDPVTCLTTYPKASVKTGQIYWSSRYFHTEASISGAVRKAGFTVGYVKSYQEQLYRGFMRTQKSDNVDHLIELLAENTK